MPQLFSTSEMVRDAMGMSGPPVSRPHKKNNAEGPILSCSRPTLIKVQVPYDMDRGSLLIYNKKKDLVCCAERPDAPAAFDRIVQVIREKGLNGMKAYFVAELKNKGALEVKVDEVLAEQPW